MQLVVSFLERRHSRNVSELTNWGEVAQRESPTEETTDPLLSHRFSNREGGAQGGPTVAANACAVWRERRAAVAKVGDSAPIIAFTHNPDIFPSIPTRVALTIAGHTHGGQVAAPIIGRPIVPSEFGERYAAGHIIEGPKHLFVTTGVGLSILPVRFRVPPEISLLTID